METLVVSCCQFESFQMAHCALQPDRMCVTFVWFVTVHGEVAESFCSHCSNKNDRVKNNEISAVISGAAVILEDCLP